MKSLFLSKLIQRLVLAISLGLLLTAAFAPSVRAQESTPWYQVPWEHAKDTWRDGDIELYVPFWTYHLPFAYRQELRDQYVEYPAGVGLGKGRINSSGNWEGMYAMGFRDSHGDASFMLGYGWVPMWNIGQTEVKVGIGGTAFLMSRKDYWGGAPFPGILPVGSLSYKNLAVQAAYVPGGNNNGNVVFMWAKWTFK